MAARDPLGPDVPPPAEPAPRTNYTVVEERGGSGGLWAVLIIALLLIVAGVLYFSGVFNGKSLYTEKNKVDIHVSAPSPGGSGGTSGSTGGSNP